MIQIFLLLIMLASQAIASDASEAGKRFEHFRDCDVCSEMVVLPSGHYLMGATEEEFREQDQKYQFMYAIEIPRHAVQVQSFALARFHVTRKQFSAFAKETSFKGKGCRTFKGARGQPPLNV